MPLDPTRILFQDQHLLAVNKLSGELVVAGKGKVEKLPLLDFLKKDFPGLRAVHRLDFETSGVVLFARTKAAYEKNKSEGSDDDSEEKKPAKKNVKGKKAPAKEDSASLYHRGKEDQEMRDVEGYHFIYELAIRPVQGFSHGAVQYMRDSFVQFKRKHIVDIVKAERYIEREMEAGRVSRERFK